MDFGAAVELYYQSRTGCPVHGVVHLADEKDKPPKLGIDEKAFERILNSVQKENKFVNQDLFSHSYRHFEKAVTQVMNTEKDFDRKFKYVKALSNTARFAAYKTAHQVYELRRLKPNDKDYHKKAQSINNKYNNLWLNTEYVHTVRSARSIKKWQQYQADKDLYPYLEYRPSRAAEPRNEHKKLYGVIKPVDDPFWDTWMPPSDWGCKCSVRQVRSNDKAKEPPQNIKKPPAAIRNNPGKNGIIFTDNHPMIKRVSKTAKGQIEREFKTQYRRYVQNKLKSLRESVFQTSDNVLVTLSKASIDKIISNDNKHYSVSNILIYDLKKILKKAKLVGEEIPFEKRQINIQKVKIYQYKDLIFHVWILKGKNKYQILHSVRLKNGK